MAHGQLHKPEIGISRELTIPMPTCSLDLPILSSLPMIPSDKREWAKELFHI